MAKTKTQQTSLLDLKTVPELPGVYIFKGAKDKILYIGKAKDLRKRLRSYFSGGSSLDIRKSKMVNLIRDTQWIVTDSELEALILESNLIKEHKPRFNIILRDDKSYPYIKITVSERWPKVEVVRRINDDGDLYFGPFVPAQSMWEALSTIRRHFMMRKCRHNIEKTRRPCIQYQMNRCHAPCAGLIDEESYKRHVEEVILFLNGKKGELLERFRQKMEQYAEDLLYEEAASMRDRIQRLERALQQQKVLCPELGDLDVIGWDFSVDRSNVAFSVLFIRKGLLLGIKNFFFDRLPSSQQDEIVESFIQSFYSKGSLPPPLVMVQSAFDNIKTYREWLSLKRQAEVQLREPTGGKETEIVKMASNNALLHRQTKTEDLSATGLAELKARFGLKILPSKIGVFDISTLVGTESSGGFVYWSQGDFKRGLYRLVRIKTVEGIDDLAMMAETIKRVLSKLEPEELPNLLLIDGGATHLQVAQKTVRELGLNEMEVLSIAKRPDRVFLPTGEVIDINDKKPESVFLRSLRDEAHRFVISYHRNRRKKTFLSSVLEEIPGIGKKRRLALLRHFGSIDAIRRSSVEEIAEVEGFNLKLAQKTYSFINKTNKESS